MRTLTRTACLAAIASATLAAHAGATVQVGQLATAPGGACATNFDHVQVSVGTGTSYVMPASGNLTSWSMRTGPGLGQQYEMKVFRVVSGLTYSVVGHSGPFPVVAGSVNTFQVTMPVQAGDVLGIRTAGPGNSDCTQAGGANDIQASRPGDLADGGSGLFVSGGGPIRLNIAGTLEPTNTFTLGTPTNDKKKGTASITVKVPNAGQLVVSGTGVAASTIPVTAAGDVPVAVVATDAKLKKLKKKGKASVSPTLTYTPTGGTATTQTATVPLVKKKKKKKKRKK